MGHLVVIILAMLLAVEPDARAPGDQPPPDLETAIKKIADLERENEELLRRLSEYDKPYVENHLQQRKIAELERKNAELEAAGVKEKAKVKVAARPVKPISSLKEIIKIIRDESLPAEKSRDARRSWSSVHEDLIGVDLRALHGQKAKLSGTVTIPWALKMFEPTNMKGTEWEEVKEKYGVKRDDYTIKLAVRGDVLKHLGTPKTTVYEKKSVTVLRGVNWVFSATATFDESQQEELAKISGGQRVVVEGTIVGVFIAIQGGEGEYPDLWIFVNLVMFDCTMTKAAR